MQLLVVPVEHYLYALFWTVVFIVYSYCSQLLGLAIIGIGVAFLLNWNPVKDELKSHLTVAPWVFIIIGAIMFVIAFFGCCGAIRESHCMVVTVCITILFLVSSFQCYHQFISTLLITITTYLHLASKNRLHHSQSVCVYVYHIANQ